MEVTLTFSEIRVDSGSTNSRGFLKNFEENHLGTIDLGIGSEVFWTKVQFNRSPKTIILLILLYQILNILSVPNVYFNEPD